MFTGVVFITLIFISQSNACHQLYENYNVNLHILIYQKMKAAEMVLEEPRMVHSVTILSTLRTGSLQKLRRIAHMLHIINMKFRIQNHNCDAVSDGRLKFRSYLPCFSDHLLLSRLCFLRSGIHCVASYWCHPSLSSCKLNWEKKRPFVH